MNLHAGDDDLFINEASTKENTKVIYTPDSLTEMDQIERFGIWKEMKVSRCCHSTVLQRKRLDILSSRIHLFLPFPSIGYRYGSDRITGQLANLLDRRIIIFDTFYNQAIVFGKSARMLQQSPTIGWLFLLEFIQPLFNGYIRIYRLFKSKKDYTFSLADRHQLSK